MGMILRFRPGEGSGYRRAVGPGQAGLRYLEAGILKLGPNERYRVQQPDREAGMVILSGRCAAQAGDKVWDNLGGRQNIFQAPPTALYVPAGAALEVTALTPFEAVIGSAPAEAGGEVMAVLPGDLKRRTVGRGAYRRSLYQVMFDNVPAKRLIIGETYNEPGGWSGYPPHKHDVDALPEESALEEIYCFKMDRPRGFGFMRIFDEGDLDETYAVQDGDFVAVPRGYHPVVNLPGQQLGYVWFMAGEKRTWLPRNHPAYLEA